MRDEEDYEDEEYEDDEEEVEAPPARRLGSAPRGRRSGGRSGGRGGRGGGRGGGGDRQRRISERQKEYRKQANAKVWGALSTVAVIVAVVVFRFVLPAKAEAQAETIIAALQNCDVDERVDKRFGIVELGWDVEDETSRTVTFNFTGTVANVTKGDDRLRAKVTVRVYGSGGKKMGSATGNTGWIDPGDTGTFKTKGWKVYKSDAEDIAKIRVEIKKR